MTFDRALRVLRQGGRVKREEWMEWTYGRDYLTIKNGHLVMVMHGGYIPSYVYVSGDEIMADDWLEVR